VAAACLRLTGAKSALPALKEALNDPDDYIRYAAKNSIEQIEKAGDQPGPDAEMQRKSAILLEINDFKERVRPKG